MQVKERQVMPWPAFTPARARPTLLWLTWVTIYLEQTEAKRCFALLRPYTTAHDFIGVRLASQRIGAERVVATPTIDAVVGRFGFSALRAMFSTLSLITVSIRPVTIGGQSTPVTASPREEQV